MKNIISAIKILVDKLKNSLGKGKEKISALEDRCEKENGLKYI